MDGIRSHRCVGLESCTVSDTLVQYNAKGHIRDLEVDIVMEADDLERIYQADHGIVLTVSQHLRPVSLELTERATSSTGCEMAGTFRGKT